MKQTYKNQSGVTLIEVLIAIFIIGAVLVLYQTSLNTSTLARESKNQETALLIASNKIQEVRAAGYDSVPATGSFADTQLASLPSGTASLTNTAFNATTKQVTVVVQWFDARSATTKDLTLSTLVASAGGL